MRACLFAAVSFVLPACFSEASNEGDACPSGTLSCPCAAGKCDASLVCEPSIDRCIEANCEPGFTGCTCLDGACSDGSECTMGVCTTPGGTSGTATASNSSTTATAESAGPGTTPTMTDSDPAVTDSDPAVTDSDPVVTDSDPVATDTVSTTSDAGTGPLDTGVETCVAPACEDCEDCGSCVECAATPVVGACGEACSGNAQCMARAQCAVLLDDPSQFAAECCGLPCDDKICGAQFGFWAQCIVEACECGDSFAC